MQSRPRTTIDIRDRNAFAKVSLQGSLNLPLSSLRHRDFLKAQALVLIDDGKSPSALLRACSELKTQGFTDVAVLIGGLRTLHAHGAVLDADAAAIDSLYQISPAEFDSEFGRPGWRTVASDAVATGSARNRITLQEALDATPLAPQLSGLLKKNPRDAIILVASAKDVKLDALAALPPDAKARVLTLSGGLDAHERYQRQQLNVVAQAGKPLVRPCNEL